MTCPRHAPALALTAAAVCLSAAPARAADPDGPEVARAIEKGVQFLRGASRPGGGEYDILSALAMAKGGAPKDDPHVAAAVEAIRGHCAGGTYTGGSVAHRLYTAGVSMMLLEAAGDPDRDREPMRVMLDYVLSRQESHGGWYYPGDDPLVPGVTKNNGDTSITQYATLGLWTAERAGLPVPADAWAKLARWQLATRLKGGGFAYHPGGSGAASQPRVTMTAAAGCNLLLCAKYLHGDASVTEARREAEAAEREAADAAKALAEKYKSLRRRRESSNPADGGGDADPAQASVPIPPASNLTGTAGRAADLIGPAYTFSAADPDAAPNLYTMYLLYTCERLGALSGKRTFGGVDWYDAGSDWVLAVQEADGKVPAPGRADMNAAFAVLFLSRATEKALGKRTSLYGGGLLKGGRGLPDDLTQARVNGDEVVFERPTGDLSDLLLALDDPAAASVPAATEAVLETVRTGDREALIGQAPRLRRLVTDPRPDVRAVALWALARGGGPGDVTAIYERLAEDPDADVAREAHNALCALARLPRGPRIPVPLSKEGEVGLRYLQDRDLPKTYYFNDRLRVLPAGPFVGLEFDATEAEKAEAFGHWRTVAADTWAAWRDRVKPYDQRDRPAAPDTAAPEVAPAKAR